MHLRDYQDRARVLLADPPNRDDAARRRLAALTCSVGDLARDLAGGISTGGWAKTGVRDTLADMLGHISGLADAHDLEMSEIAVASLIGLANRRIPSPAGLLFDTGFPEDERLPRHLSYEFTSAPREDGTIVTRIHLDGTPIGDPLTDAATSPDDYRLHDVFHLAYATHLGWSPVTRALIGRKRRSNPRIDENEDGGRAIVIEEAASALVFSHAPANDYFSHHVDPALLEDLLRLVGPFEVGARPSADWRRAILDGYAMWHNLREHDGHGTVHADLLARTLAFQPQPRVALQVAMADAS